MGLRALAHALEKQASSVAALRTSWGTLNSAAIDFLRGFTSESITGARRKQLEQHPRSVAEDLIAARRLYGGIADQLISARLLQGGIAEQLTAARLVHAGVAEQLHAARRLYGGVAEQLIEAAQIRRAREGR
jgi:hypothetical protein